VTGVAAAGEDIGVVLLGRGEGVITPAALGDGIGCGGMGEPSEAGV
jgi:hypothetical protein